MSNQDKPIRQSIKDVADDMAAEMYSLRNSSGIVKEYFESEKIGAHWGHVELKSTNPSEGED